MTSPLTPPSFIRKRCHLARGRMNLALVVLCGKIITIIHGTTRVQDIQPYEYCSFLSFRLPTCLSLCLYVSMSLCLCVYVSLCLCVSVSLCVSMSMCLYVSMCLCVSVSLCICKRTDGQTDGRMDGRMDGRN